MINLPLIAMLQLTLKLILIVLIMLRSVNCNEKKEPSPTQSVEFDHLHEGERTLRTRLEMYKIRYKYVGDLLRFAQTNANESKSQTIAMLTLIELLTSIDAILPRSVVNIEKEWQCSTLPLGQLEHKTFKFEEYKFTTRDAYVQAQHIFDQAKQAMDTIEDMVNMLLL